MSYVFISYSRLDREFVGKLREELELKIIEEFHTTPQENAIWIDWEDIPPSRSWWSEIQKGIEKTNNFVVVLSPNSMASPICHMELEYARQLGKRIIPVLHQDYDRDTCVTAIASRLANPQQEATRDLWQARQPYDMFDANDSVLKHINYFFFQPEQNFLERFDALFDVIKTDYEHKEIHTTLGLRAEEWQKRDKNPSFLLIYDELAGMQQWLAEAYRENSEPRPTPLQEAYIQASERRTRTLRNIRWAAVIATIAAIITTIIAASAAYLGSQSVSEARADFSTASYLQELAADSANRAEANLAAANTNATAIAIQIAEGEKQIESLGLAAGAVSLKDQNPANALSLAVAAVRYPDPPIFAQNTLADNAYLPNIRRQLDVAPNRIYSVAFSPVDGKALVGLNTGEVLLWDTDTDTILHHFLGHMDRVWALAFSPDGQFALTGDFGGVLILRDVTTGQDVRTFAGHPDSNIVSLAFSPDGTRAVTGSDDKSVRLWDVTTGELLDTWYGYTAGVRTVAFSPDGEHVAAGDRRGRLRIWNITTGQTTTVLAHQDGIESVAFSPDGRLLASGAKDQTIKLWNVATGKLTQTLLGHEDFVTSVIFQPDGQGVISGANDETVRWWDITTGLETRSIRGFGDTVWSIDINASGNRLIVGLDTGIATVWDITYGTEIRRMPAHDNTITRIAVSPDGQQAITASKDATLKLWDMTTGEYIRSFIGHNNEVHSVAFSPDGRTVVSGSSDGYLWLWDVASGEPIRALDTTGKENDNIYAVAFSPDGQTVAAGYQDKLIRIWNVYTGEQTLLLEGNYGWVTSVVFSPDGQTLLSGSTDYSVRLWDVNTGDQLQRFTPAHTNRVTSVAFSPDGKTVLSGSEDHTLKLWDVETGRELRTFYAHTHKVLSVGFSPNGQLAISGAEDDTLKIWDITSGFVLRSLEAHSTRVTSVVFSPDGHQVLSGGADGSLMWWRIDTTLDELINWTYNNRYVQELTCAQRIQYAVAPYCDENNQFPTRTPYLTWTPTTPPTVDISPAATLYTPTPTGTATPTVSTRTPTPTPISQPAHQGENAGVLVTGSVDLWTYAAQTGETLTIRLNATGDDGLDPRLILRVPDGTALENDDADDSTRNSLLDQIDLQGGTYEIEVRSFENKSGGAYTLIIESNLAATATPTPSATPTSTATP